MTYKEVSSMIGSIDLPYAYTSFAEDSGQQPPFICFYFEGSRDFSADNTNYQRIRPLTIELYTDNKDFALEETVENTLNTYGLVYTRSETYIASERMYMVAFYTNIIITDDISTEDNNG